jgi:hypothetical protein
MARAFRTWKSFWFNASPGSALPRWFRLKVEKFWLTDGFTVRYGPKQGKNRFPAGNAESR